MKTFLRKLWCGFPLFRMIRRAQAAPLLAERINLQQEQIAILQTHLAISRSMLSTVMRDRDHFEGALDRTCRELALLKQQRRQERERLRIWLTRCMAVCPSEN